MTIPFPQLAPMCCYRHVEKLLQHIDNNIKFNHENNRTFTPSISKLELYNKLYAYKDKDKIDYERQAVALTLNMIRLYMSKDEKLKLKKTWIKI